MKKFTSIIGEVGPTNAHLINLIETSLYDLSKFSLLLLNIKASANVNVSVI
jgi:hypothetical protein